MASIVAERLIVRLERDGVVISGAHRPTSAWSEATGHLANCRRDDEIGEGGAIEARTRAFGRPPRWEQFLRYPALARFFCPPAQARSSSPRSGPCSDGAFLRPCRPEIVSLMGVNGARRTGMGEEAGRSLSQKAF